MADEKLFANVQIHLDSTGRKLVSRIAVPATDPVPKIDKKTWFKAALEARTRSATAIAKTVKGLRADLDRLIGGVRPSLPARLRGRLVDAEGRPGARLAVEMLPPAPDQPWPVPRAVSDAMGRFDLRLPPGILPPSGITLRVIGKGRVEHVPVRRIDAEAGDAGLIVLAARFEPDESLIERLIELFPSTVEDVDTNPDEYATPTPPLLFSEEDACARSFQSNTGVIDHFSYSLLVRLIEPSIGPGQLVFTFPGTKIKLPNPLVKYPLAVSPDVLLEFWEDAGTFMPGERAPLGGPVDVAGFHQDAAFSPGDVPKASSLAIGYVVKMRQVWIPTGLSLGDLVYSLPLAPGEEQRIVVVEQDERLDVREHEGVQFAEEQRFREATDATSSALFQSALRQMAHGESEVSSTSHSFGFGLLGGIATFVGGLLGVGAAGGYSKNWSSGTSSTEQYSSRDFVSKAAQDMHSTLSRNAMFARTARRTSVRQATSVERTSVASKRIANHNHCHALTIQYFEVLRHYSVGSDVADVQLVCFVPLDLVPFCASGQEGWCVDDPAGLTRALLLERYRYLLRYWDLLQGQVRPDRALLAGLDRLKEFAADPSMQVEPATAPAQQVIAVDLTGTFMSFETVTVTVVARDGRTVGPFTLMPTAPIPEIKVEDHETLDSYLAALRTARTDRNATLAASIALPPDIRRNDVARFDFRRRFTRVSGTFKLPQWLIDAMAAPPPPTSNDYWTYQAQQANYRRMAAEITKANRTVITAADFEREIEGPLVFDIDATIASTTDAYIDILNSQSDRVMMLPTMPVTARRLTPLLSFQDLLLVESVYQHVARHSVAYSKLVWASLSAEERVMMLEPYTIGFEDGGADDPEQQIPLLNCVANQVLGFYGNSMIMPFHVPPALVDARGVSSRDLQDAIIRFHRETFRTPRTTVALPTRGVLGEAVLGACNTCEKIDLTRFWNWQDSPPLQPGDTGVAPPTAAVGQKLVGDAVAAPSALAPIASKINLIGNITQAAPNLDPAIIQALATKGATQKTGAPDTITGIVNSAAIAKKSALLSQQGLANVLSASQKMAETALESYPNAARADAGLPLPEKKEAAAAPAAAKPADAAAKPADGAKAEDKPATAATPVATFIAKAASLIAYVSLQTDKNVAAKTVVNELGIDPSELGLLDKADLAKALQPVKDDTAPITDAKNALQSALHLK
jgi:hypothetical protein